MTWAMTSAQVAVMPQVYHLFRACGVRGGCPAGRTMMSCGVRAGPSGGRGMSLFNHLCERVQVIPV